MSETTVPSLTPAPPLVLHNGKSVQTITVGKANAFKAKSGEHYRVIKGNEGEAPLLDNVVAKRAGNDLLLAYAGGTQLTLENYYVECQAGACDVSLPGKAGEDYKINAASSGGASLGDGSTLVYAHGDSDAMAGMAQGDAAMQTAFANLVGAKITYEPSAFEMGAASLGLLGAGLGLAAAAAAGGGAVAAAVAAVAETASTIVAGTIMAGPVMTGNGLTVNLYKADGVTLLGAQKLSASGSYSIDIGSFTGAVIGKLVDSDAGNDFMDEATAQARDMNADLMAIGVVGSGSNTINFNALTTIAAMKAGAVFAGTSVGVMTSTLAIQANAAVASSFGLTDLIGSSVTTTVDGTGAANAAYTPAALSNAVKYGAVLAALSAMDSINAGDMQATINELVSGTTVVGSTATLSNLTVEAVMLGANSARSHTSGSDASSLTAIISSLTSYQTSASVSIDQIATDSVINNSEKNSSISGTTVAGASVSVTLGGNVRAATVDGTGTTWGYALTDTDITAMGQGGAVITATASLAGGGTATTTRGVVVDTLVPAAPVINSVATDNTINATEVGSAISGSNETGASVALSIGGNTRAATVTGTSWSYTLVTADISAMGEGSATLSATQTDAAGNTSNAITRVITVETVAPQAPSLGLAIDSGSSGTDGVSDTGTVTVSGIEASASWEYSTNSGASWSVGGVVSAGASSFTLGAGVYVANAVQVRQSDVAGNLSAVGLSAAVYTIDATAPTLAALNPLSSADSQGSINTYMGPSDNLVLRLSESVVKGTGNIRIVNDTDTTTTTIAIGSDEITIGGNVVTINPSSDLVLGKAYHVEVDATALLDLAGNAYTGISGSTNWNFQVPDPAISLNLMGTDSRINASENTGAIAVSGTVSANTAGIVSGVVMANISITLTPQAGGTTVTLIASAYDTSNGDWSASIGANTLVNGKTYTVLATLATTISSTAYTATSSSVLEVDTTAPTLVISTPISGGYLNDAEDELPLTILGTSSGADARAVTVLVGSTSKTATIAAGGNWSVSLSSTELKALSEGSISVTGNVSDVAGNAATQATASFVYDKSTPTESVSSVQMSADTNSTTDFITNTAAQTISGTLSAVLVTGDTLYGSVDNGATWTDITSKVSGTAITWTGATLAGSSTIVFKIIDAAGNVGTSMGSQTYVLDTTAPTLAALNPFSPADSQGSTTTYMGPSDNLVLRLSESVVKGTGNIRIVNDTNSTTTTIAIGSGEITIGGNVVTINPSSDLVLGKAYHVEVDASALLDLAGNAYTGISGSTNWNFQVPDPAISLNLIGTDSRINASENTGAIAVSGTVSANTAGIVSGVVMANISITLTPQEGGTTVTLTASAYNTSTGAWSASIGANTLVNGKTYTVLATLATTISSTAYTATSSSVLEVDTSAPTLAITGPISGGYLNDLADENPLIISGTSSGADARAVTVLVGSTSKTATIAAGGSWSVSLSSTELKALSVGTISVTANVSDVAGNAATQATASFVYDRTAPTQTVTSGSVHISADTNSTTDFITYTAAQTITCTLSAGLVTGDTLYGSVDNGATWTNISSKVSGTAITWTGATLAGSSTIVFKIIDAAGNVGASMGSRAYVLDTTAPTISSMTMSASGAQNNTLNAGDVVSVSVTMSEATTVVTTGGTPQLALVIGATTVQAAYASGSGSSALVFNYTILANQTDTNGISIAANSLALNGGTLKDVAGNAATLTHSLVADNASYLVDTAAPSASVTTATMTNAGNASVQSTEIGTAYLVNNSVTVTNLASITGAADNVMNSVSISAASTSTDLAAAGLLDGTYKVYTADAAGNLSAASSNSVTLDTTAPTVTNTSASYTAPSDTLIVTGLHYDTLLSSGETATTDIKARLDWTKLSWDINGDNATTADVSFALSDIASAKVTDSTHLTIVLNSAKATAFEATAGYGGTPLDTLDIAAGFARDALGNTATTDAVANAPLTLPLYVAGQAVIDLGSTYGKLIAPVQVEGKWYYYWDRSGDGTSANTGTLNGGRDTTTHDVLDALFIENVTGNIGNGNYADWSPNGTSFTFRYATLGNVQVALPTINGPNITGTADLAPPSGFNQWSDETAYSDAGATSNGTTSATGGDYIAIWDAYNGSRVAQYYFNWVDIFPSAWKQNAWYWASTADQLHQPNQHMAFYTYSGGGFWKVDTDAYNVVLQVL